MLTDISQITAWTAEVVPHFFFCFGLAIWSMDRRVVIFATVAWLSFFLRQLSSSSESLIS
ncbi:hypothetical protein BGW80DRAFT_1400441 [Lactifluus volemus]|nr:hypothetical protein BGW80DRAFT_1400441 [Lactifluus volemus]